MKRRAIAWLLEGVPGNSMRRTALRAAAVAERSAFMTRTIKHDRSIDPEKAALYSVPLAVATLALVVLPHQAAYGDNALKALFRAVGGWWFGPLLLGGIAVHEALHAVTWLIAGKLQLRDVAFGVTWRVLMPYSHPRRPLTVRAYALGALMPGLVLGAIPAVVGLSCGLGAWSGWGAIFLAAACGDLLVLWSLRGLDRSTLVQDHPVRVGCEVVSDAPDA